MNRLPTHVAKLARPALATLLAWGLTAVALAGAPGTWSPTGPLAKPRYAFTLTRLDANHAIVAGGQSQEPVPHGYRTYNVATAEVYNAATGTWSSVPSMSRVRVEHEAVQIAEGRVLVAGGLDGTPYSLPLPSAEIYNATTNSWSPVPGMAVGRYYFTLTRLNDGRVLAAGGCDTYGCGSATAGAEIFDPVTGTWSVTNSMAVPRAGHTATLLMDGRVLVTSGDSFTWDSSEIYDPATGAWADAGILAIPRSAHTATLLPSGQVLVAGGLDMNGAILANAEAGDAGAALWASANDMRDPRQYHVLVSLNDGRALAIGGQRVVLHSFVDIARCETFDEGTGTWTATGSMSIPREGHRGLVLGNGQVLVTGGVDGASGLFTRLSELYTPENVGRTYLETFDGQPEGAPISSAGWHALAGTANPSAVASEFCVNDIRNVLKVTAFNDAGSQFTSGHAFVENDYLAADPAGLGRGDALLYTNEFLAANSASSLDINGATVSVDYSNGDAANAGPALQFAFQLSSGQWFVHESALAGNTTQSVTSGVMATGPISSSIFFVPLIVEPGNSGADARLVPDIANRRTLSGIELSKVIAAGIYSNPAPQDVSPTRIDNYRLSGFSVGCLPGLVSRLHLTALPGNVSRLTWGSGARATAYDLVRGSLQILASTHGDFAAAIDQCLANNLTGNTVDDATVPTAGAGYFYVARSVGCESGSYDSGSVSQEGSRDASILASGSECP